MDDRDTLILEHLGRYTISIRYVIEELFFDGGSCANALTRLEEKKLVQRIPKAFLGNYSYYQLTAKGAATQGLPANRGGKKNETVAAQSLGALWFSVNGPTWRKRLTNTELETLFGAPPGGNVIYVAQNGQDEDTAVFRLFIPDSEASVKTAYARALKKAAIEAMESRELRPWIERGTYRFAVLVHGKIRKDELQRSLQSVQFPNLQVHVEIAPTPETLAGFLPGKEETD
jgi:hypothetical protein